MHVCSHSANEPWFRDGVGGSGCDHRLEHSSSHMNVPWVICLNLWCSRLSVQFAWAFESCTLYFRPATNGILITKIQAPDWGLKRTGFNLCVRQTINPRHQLLIRCNCGPACGYVIGKKSERCLHIMFSNSGEGGLFWSEFVHVSHSKTNCST